MKGFRQMIEKHFPDDKAAFEEYISEIPIAINY